MDAISTYGFDLVRDEQIDEIKTRGAPLPARQDGRRTALAGERRREQGLRHRLPHAAGRLHRHRPHSGALGAGRLAEVSAQGTVRRSCSRGRCTPSSTPSPRPTKRPTRWPAPNCRISTTWSTSTWTRSFTRSSRPHHLDQEGWHYELEAPDASAGLPRRRLQRDEGRLLVAGLDPGRAANQGLFPDNAYGLDSGGDPTVIPQLTYAQFIDFHRTYYHPSNARIFFYGDDAPEERLRILGRSAGRVRRQPGRCRGAAARALCRPATVCVYTFGADGESDLARKSMVRRELGAARSDRPVAAHGAERARVRHHRHAGVAAAQGPGRFRPRRGCQRRAERLRAPAHLQRNHEGHRQCRHAPKVEALIIDTLEQLAADGIDPDMVEAALNSIEFSLRENNTGSFPRGSESLHPPRCKTGTTDRDPLAAVALRSCRWPWSSAAWPKTPPSWAG